MEDPFVLAVDFDGTIVEHKFPKIGNVIGRCIEILKEFQEKYDVQLVLWTSRCGYELAQAIEFCTAQDLVFSAVNTNVFFTPAYGIPKIIYSAVIDDRSLEYRLRTNRGNLTPEIWEEIAVQVPELLGVKRAPAAQ
jgi:hypothetical protein